MTGHKMLKTIHLKVIHFSAQMSSQSSIWKMRIQIKLDITWKLIPQFQFCKKILIVHNLRNQTV